VSLQTDTLEAVKDVVDGLGLQHRGVSVPVVVRKLPAVEEQLDSVPMVCVYPERDDLEWFSFRSQVSVYPVGVAVVRPADGNLAMESTAAAWREDIRDAFRSPRLSGVSEVWDADVEPGEPLDERLYSKNYDYMTLLLRFKATEPAVS
jgi:hypothetical protein